MGQSFQLIAPRAKLALSWSGKLGEILFDGSARDLVCLLAVPVRRQHDSPRNSLVDPTNTIYRIPTMPQADQSPRPKWENSFERCYCPFQSSSRNTSTCIFFHRGY
ncbi:hypothetical protein F4823DRAFT_573820 [Ustulina deusta]|nr:hypothetical protein F4823DRAFT_573820 [Ustulina deusta]